MGEEMNSLFAVCSTFIMHYCIQFTELKYPISFNILSVLILGCSFGGFCLIG